MTLGPVLWDIRNRISDKKWIKELQKNQWNFSPSGFSYTFDAP